MSFDFDFDFDCQFCFIELYFWHVIKHTTHHQLGVQKVDHLVDHNQKGKERRGRYKSIDMYVVSKLGGTFLWEEMFELLSY